MTDVGIVALCTFIMLLAIFLGWVGTESPSKQSPMPAQDCAAGEAPRGAGTSVVTAFVAQEIAHHISDKQLKLTIEDQQEALDQATEKAEWLQKRLDLLQSVQHNFREPERTVVCDLLANGGFLPDPDGQRYGGKATQWKKENDHDRA